MRAVTHDRAEPHLKGPDPAEQAAADGEVTVTVVFVGPDFELCVPWDTDTITSDDARVEGAVAWFSGTYQMNPADHAHAIIIQPA